MERGVAFALVSASAVPLFALGGCTNSGAGPADAAPPCIDADIRASNYDQSCKVDTDCQPIAEGNACVRCGFVRANAAINVAAVPRYNMDIANKPAVSSGVNGQSCVISLEPPTFGPSCVDGTCQMGFPPDAGCEVAGGQCVVGNVICAVPGPQSCGGVTPAGAYCCLSNVADCGQPDETTYACPGAADGGPSCHGGAPPPIGIPNSQALAAGIDQDASYPAGCKVTFPGCNAGRVPYCTCSGSSPGNSGWTCFF